MMSFLYLKGFLIKIRITFGSLISLDEQTPFANRIQVGKQPKEIKKGFSIWQYLLVLVALREL